MQVELIEGAIEGAVGVDEAAAESVEAVAAVEIIVLKASEDEDLISAVKIHVEIADEIVFAQSVVIVVGIVDGVILRGEITAEIDEGALIGWDVWIGEKARVGLKLLQLLNLILLLGEACHVVALSGRNAFSSKPAIGVGVSGREVNWTHNFVQLFHVLLICQI